MAEKRGARHFWQRKSSRGPGSGTRAGPKTTGAGMPAWWTSAVCGNFETAAGAAYYKVKEGKVFMTLLKRFAVTAVAGMVAGAMLCTSAAAVAVTSAATTPTYDLEAGKITLTINKNKDNLPIKPGNEYVLLVAKGKKGATDITIDASTLTYIDQAEATADGTLSFTVYPKSAQTDDIILLGGEFEGVTGPLIIGYINVKGEIVSIPSIPVVDFVEENGTVNKANDIGLKVMSADNTLLAEAQADDAGSVSFTIPEDQTTVTLQITRPGYLPLTITNYEVGADITEQLSNFKKCAGNLNGDDHIDMLDITILIGKFDKADPNAEDVCNLTKDDVIDILDIQVILGNYDRTAGQMTMSAK